MTDQNVHDKEKENGFGFEKNFFHIDYTVIKCSYNQCEQMLISTFANRIHFDCKIKSCIC